VCSVIDWPFKTHPIKILIHPNENLLGPMSEQSHRMIAQ
jgi:hypothetical protein